MAAPPLIHTPGPEPKKKLIRRITPDGFQRTRHIVQYVFVALNAWIGLQFYLWVRFYERGGAGFAVPRPAGAEGWLPIAGLMNFKLFLSTGQVPAIHPAAMFLFTAFVAMSLVGSAQLERSQNIWRCSAAASSAETCSCRAGSTFPCAASNTCCWPSLSSSSAPCRPPHSTSSCRRLTASSPT